MASSTKKWKKQQREYARRKRQATRRKEERNQQNKKIKNMIAHQRLASVLGIVAGQGFTKNVLPQAIATSKLTQANYLTTTLRKRRMKERMKHLLTAYNNNKDEYTSPLHYAIRIHEPHMVHFYLQEPGTNLEEKNIYDRTPLEEVLSDIIMYREHSLRGYNTVKHKEMDEEAYVERQEILKMLIDAGAKTPLSTLLLFWGTGLNMEEYLKSFPGLKRQSYLLRNEILTALSDQLQDRQEQLDLEKLHIEEYPNNANSISLFSLAYVEAVVQLHEESLKLFKSFLKSYNPRTGAYNLSVSVSDSENNFSTLDNSNF